MLLMSFITHGKFHNQTLVGMPDIPLKNEEFACAPTLAEALHDVVTLVSIFQVMI